jgi:4-diphosphocytidyl-2-C-methyl-D-erythritol kinase
VDTLTLNSYAKVNLYLGVLNKRKDNYHNIITIFERIDLADKIILKSRRDRKISVICDHPSVPQDSSNLACRSARLLQDKFNINKGVDIKIIKRIPVGSGMGGGSSNAAYVLMGLNKLWKIGLSQDKLAWLGGKIGSDVPFFIYNTPFAKGASRGDKIEPLKTIAGVKLWHILVVPKIHVSTPLIYKKWDKFVKTFELTTPRHNVKILTLALKNNDLTLIGDSLFNSLEQVTIKLYPQIGRIKEKLIRLGAKSILMSGSGPALFGIVSSGKEALSLCNQLKTNNSFCQVFVTRTR